MSRASWALGGLAVVCWATTAAGQSVTPLRLGVALGTTLGDNSWLPRGGHATISLTSQPAGSRFGLRVEALFYGAESYRPLTFGAGNEWRSQQAIALTINGTYRLVGPRTGLYAIAGAGLYRGWSEYRSERFPPDTTMSGSATSTGLTVNAGLGFDFRAFGRELFIESKLHSGVFDNRVPISLGIRF